MIWYGPEVVITGGYKVSAMQSMTIVNDDLRFFCSAFKDGSPPIFFWVSLPISGSPIQDMVSGGKHRFATGSGSGTVTPNCILELLPEGWDDRAAKKFLHEHTVTSRGLSIRGGVNDGLGTKLVFEDRADPVPGSTTWTTSTDVTTSPMQTVLPTTVVEGHQIGRRLKFVSPQGGATPPKPAILDSIRTTAWRVVPSFDVWPLTVEYGEGVVNRHNVADARDPDTVSEQLVALSQYGRTVMRDYRDRRYTVKVEQALVREPKVLGTGQAKSMKAQIEVTIINRLVA